MPQTQPSELRPHVVQAAQRMGVAYWTSVSGGPAVIVAGGEPGGTENGPSRERPTYPSKREKENCFLKSALWPFLNYFAFEGSQKMQSSPLAGHVFSVWTAIVI